jgi:hypothetical protein
VYDIQKDNINDEIIFYIDINDEKEKKSWRLCRIEDFIFYLSSMSSVLSKGILGELVKCKTSKIYRTTKNFCQTKYIRPLSRILETLIGHVRPQARHVRLSALSGLAAGFQRRWPDMSDPRPGHVQVSDTPTARFSWRAIKDPHASLAWLVTHFTL